MDQFTHLPEVRVIICRKCQYAVLPSEIDSHFTKSPDHRLRKASRRYIIQEVAKIGGLIQDQQQLRDGFTFPPPGSPAIPELGEPKKDGLGCTLQMDDGKPCRFVYRHEQQIREHCAERHHWVNMQKRGRPRKGGEAVGRPWREGVHCQRIFKQGLCSRYFEVQSQPIPAGEDTAEAKARRSIQDQMDKVKERERKRIETSDPAQEPNPWLRKVRWDHHLSTKDPQRLRMLIRAVGEEEEELGVIHASFQRIIDACCMHATDNVVGEAALCTVNSIEYGKKVQEPFYMDMKENTRVKYQAVWLQLLSYVVRSETDLAAENRPGYRLTRQQRDGFDALMSQAAAFHGVEVTDAMSRPAARQMEALDWQCLRFCIQLLDHRLPGDAYESVIISGLSILGVREGGGWLEAIEYTTSYSAVVKLARALVVEQAYQTRQRQINTARQMGSSEEAAHEIAESHYILVRRMVDRFMGLEGGGANPTPWIGSSASGRTAWRSGSAPRRTARSSGRGTPSYTRRSNSACYSCRP